MSLEEFAPHVGASFALSTEEASPATASLVLIEVERDPRANESGRPFHLVFEGSSEIPLDQDTYWLRCDGEGSTAIFLVPIGPGRYEAVFN